MADKYLLDEYELAFLAARSGCKRLLAQRDPFYGWLAEMVLDRWRQSKPQMLANGLLVTNETGKEIPEPNLAELLAACGKSEVCLSMLWRAEGKTRREIQIYLPAPGKFICVERQEASEKMELFKCEEVFDLLGSLLKDMPENIAQSSTEADSFDIMQKAWTQLLKNEAASADCQPQSAGSDSAFEHFRQAISGGHTEITFMVYKLRNLQLHISGFELCSVPGHLWRARLYKKGSADWYKVTGFSKEELKRDIETVMKQR